MTLVLAFLAAALAPQPFTLVNGTGGSLDSLSIRPVLGPARWEPLPPGRLSPGARGSVPALAGEDCLFTIRASAGGALLEWQDVNLCDAKSVTLRYRAPRILWVEYD